MATVRYYTGQRPTQYKDALTQTVATGLNEFLAEAVRLGGGSARLQEFIKLTGIFQAPIRNYDISVTGSNVIADGMSYSLEQGVEVLAGTIALDYVTKALAAIGITSAAVAVGFSAVAFAETGSAIAVALVTHELFSHFGVQNGIKSFVDGIFGTEAVWVEAFDKQGDLVRGASYGGGLGGLREIEAVQGLIQHAEVGGTIAVDNQIGVERAASFSSYTLKAANLAEQIATPLLKTAQDVLGWNGAQDENGQPKHNSDVFIPYFNEFTIVNDQAKIVIEIPLGSTTEHLALSVRAIATNGDVSGLREFGTVAVFGSSGADSMQVPNFSTDPSSQKVYAFGGDGGDTIRTGAGNDVIFGDNADINSSAANRPGDGADIIHAGRGNDVVYGGGQSDQIFGEEGNDKLYGQDGEDQIAGGDGEDQIFGGLADDVLNGGADNDQISGGFGKDTIDGGDGDDILNAGSDIPGENDDAPNSMFGGTGKDRLLGALGDDELAGGDGRDQLVGLAGNDQFFGGRDGDTYTGGPDADEFYVGPQDRVLDGSAEDKLFLQFTQVTSTTYFKDFEEFGAFPNFGLRKGYNYYAIGDTDSQRQHLLINTGHTLVVFFADGQVAALANYHKGDFGISVPDPGEFLTRANQEFSASWGSLHNSHLITEPYTKLLTEALRIEAAMSATPDAPLEISASAKEYVAKILHPELHGPGYDAATEGISTITPLRAQNGESPQSSAPGVIVTGTGDSEFLPGTDGADTIAGGAGTDILYGGSGPDTYVYHKDDGFDSIIDFAGAGDLDTLQLADLNPDDVTVTGDGADLMIHNRSRAAIDHNGEAYTTLFVAGQFEGDGSGAEQIQFADGTIWNRDAIAGHAMHAPTGANIVFGGSVPENAAAGTFVAQLAGIDADFDSRFSYSLVNDPGGLFTVTASGGINVASGAAIDFESATTHDVIVRITDQTGLSFDKTLTVAVENVVGPTITGTDANDTLTGTIEDDVLVGLGGNDSLDGGAGPDRMAGGTGNDTYTVDNPGDIILENPGEGTDTVETALAACTLGDNVENLTGIGTASQVLSGNALDNAISGGAGDDTLVGNAGNDVLTGGSGYDIIDGGAGINTAIYSGRHSDYVVARLSANSLQISDARAGSPDGLDTASSIQNFQFSDNAYTFDEIFATHVFGALGVPLAAFNPANGWTSDNSFHRELADVNGDGMADIIGFGNPGVLVSLATGSGGFAAPEVKLGAFNPANGWTSDNAFHRELADVNGDHMADIVGFGNGGVYVALATGGGNFAAAEIKLAAFNPGNGWTSQDQFPRELADLNGDGMADIVAFGNGGVYVALATGGGNFAAPEIKLGALNPGNGWTSQDQFPRELADVNGDHMADIGGFGNGGVYVALATGGGNFATPVIGVAALNPGNGWTTQHQFPRELGDVNHDGMADIVGFGNGGVYVALATGGGHFAAPAVDIAAFNPANGWTGNDQFHREVADVNGDGFADIVGFGNPGVLEALSNDGFHLV
jgi:Ca2+-binding RTX toxin-like protein